MVKKTSLAKDMTRLATWMNTLLKRANSNKGLTNWQSICPKVQSTNMVSQSVARPILVRPVIWVRTSQIYTRWRWVKIKWWWSTTKWSQSTIKSIIINSNKGTQNQAAHAVLVTWAKAVRVVMEYRQPIIRSKVLKLRLWSRPWAHTQIHRLRIYS